MQLRPKSILLQKVCKKFATSPFTGAGLYKFTGKLWGNVCNINLYFAMKQTLFKALKLFLTCSSNVMGDDDNLDAVCMYWRLFVYEACYMS